MWLFFVFFFVCFMWWGILCGVSGVRGWCVVCLVCVVLSGGDCVVCGMCIMFCCERRGV